MSGLTVDEGVRLLDLAEERARALLAELRTIGAEAANRITHDFDGMGEKIAQAVEEAEPRLSAYVERLERAADLAALAAVVQLEAASPGYGDVSGSRALAELRRRLAERGVIT